MYVHINHINAYVHTYIHTYMPSCIHAYIHFGSSRLLLKSFWLRDPSEGRIVQFTVLCTAMADHKLISCIGYSLRLATKQGRVSFAQHLWHGLYALTQGQNENECVSIARPLCVYILLWVWMGMSQMRRICLGQRLSEILQPAQFSIKTLPQANMQALWFDRSMIKPPKQKRRCWQCKSLKASFKRSRKIWWRNLRTTFSQTLPAVAQMSRKERLTIDWSPLKTCFQTRPGALMRGPP